MKPPEVEDDGQNGQKDQSRAPPPEHIQVRLSFSSNLTSGFLFTRSSRAHGSPTFQNSFSRQHTPSTSSTYPPSQSASSPSSAASPVSPPQNYRQQSQIAGSPFAQSPQSSQSSYTYPAYTTHPSYVPESTYAYASQSQAPYTQASVATHGEHSGYAHHHGRHSTTENPYQSRSAYGSSAKQPTVSHQTSPYATSPYTTAPYTTTTAPTYSYAPSPQYYSYPSSGP
ncbi:unnamed protein product [Periconia digitata]|uniref:Uncharacterized protein n=1 Tax=Periconia digitata TaxID=1303443 RepID=A0A9W4UDF1_9PLEO|nr:unnamed protein product [Periconia digitata]